MLNITSYMCIGLGVFSGFTDYLNRHLAQLVIFENLVHLLSKRHFLDVYAGDIDDTEK